MDELARLAAQILQTMFLVGMIGCVFVFVLFGLENLRTLTARDDEKREPGSGQSG
jgi:hypothetical protein